MTEAEWQTCDDPKAMLTCLRGKVSDRKWWLLACSCCRLLWHRFSDWRIRRVVDYAEQFADGEVTEEELAAVRDEVRVASKGGVGAFALLLDQRKSGWSAASRCIDGLWCLTAGERIRQHIIPGYHDVEGWPLLREQIVQLLRDVAGAPSGTARVASHWLAWGDRTVPALAQMVYERRAFDLLPILADALEDAGCTDEAILDLLRGPGPHVRGCFALDLLLGKE